MKPFAPLNPSVCTALLAFLTMACGGGDGRGARAKRAATLQRTNACAYREAGSRWAPRGGRYRLAAEFGGRAGEELVDLWGIAATPSGEIAAYDNGGERILRLDRELRMTGSFGRKGRGPGEIFYVDQAVPHGDWIAADDTSLVVLDLNAMSRFDTSGVFSRYPGRQLPSRIEVRRIALRRGRVVYALDHLRRPSGERSIQTWRMEPSGQPTLLRTDSMPPLSTAHGRITMGSFALQAQPLWATRGRCAFISDGAGDWVLRVDLDANRADTLGLPHREPAELTREDERRLGMLREGVARVTHRRSGNAEPTAHIKWADVRVDPDGYVWLEPWRFSRPDDEPIRAWVVNPATGAVDSVAVPDFPAAFLPGGAFVAKARDPATGVWLLCKYVLESAR